MSKFVRQWVQSIEIRRIRVQNEREGPYDTKPLTPAHKQVLEFLATRARDNGRTWLSMDTIAAATGTERRQAQRNIRDLERGGLLKTEIFRGRRRRATYECNEYWVAVPWVSEPEHVSDLEPQPLDKDRVIDVDAYIRRARVSELNASPETPKPGSLNSSLNSSPVEPGSARGRARDGDFFRDGQEIVTQLAFPPIAVVGAPVPVVAAQRELAAVPLRRDCPDCRQSVGALTGKGHAPECWRLGLRSSDPYFLASREEIEAAIAMLPVAAEASS